MGNEACCGEETVPGVQPPIGGTNYGLYQNGYNIVDQTVRASRTMMPSNGNMQNQYQYQQNIMASNINPQVNILPVNPEAPPPSYAIQADGLPNLPEVVIRSIDQNRSQPLRSDGVCQGVRLPPYFLVEKNAYYEGEWRAGRPHGKGRVFYADRGAYFEGQFRDGHADCSDGLFVYPEGTTYRGAVKNSMANGLGVLTFQNGEFRYEGNWLNDKPNGPGKEYYKDGSRFEGSFLDGNKSGNGRYTWKDGSSYDGNFVNGLMEGYGVQVLPNSQIYKGNFKKNKRQGSGTLETRAGKYIGQFKNDKKNGYGEFRYNDGKIFKGDFKDGRPHGRGQVTFPNGQSSIGIWQNGQNVSIEKIIGPSMP